MGTRNLTCVVLGGEYKIAQYGQWDGYPSGQGSTILEFLLTADRPAFVEKVRAAKFHDADSIRALNEQIERDGLQNTWTAKWPWLSRDAGGKILAIVDQHEPGIQLKNDIEFAADSLFCEFAYVVDFDKGTFEVFKGFNQDPLAEGERFAFLGDKSDQAHRDTEYTPVKHLHTFQLDALPTLEEFLALLEPKGEDE